MTPLETISLAQLLFVLIVLLLAYTIKGMAGFGSGLIAVPLLALIMPLPFVVPMLGLISYSGTVIQSYQLRKSVDWHDCLVVLPFSIVGIAIALWLLKSIELYWLNKSLALFVMGYALISLLPGKELVRNRRWGMPAGFFAGLVGALFGTGGPFYVLYLKLRRLDKEVFRSTISMIFLFDGAIRIAGYSGAGFYNRELIFLSLLSFPILLLGLYIGHHIQLKISKKRFNQSISLLLFVSGLVLFIK